MSRLHLQLLRSPMLRRADGRVVALNANDAALLTLLAVDGPTPRDRLVAWLLPAEPDTGHARSALRQRLFRLRRSAAADVVRGDELLMLDDAVDHDLTAWQAALLDDPGAAVQGDLLGTLVYDELDEFAGWLAVARERWRSRRRDALAALASRLEAEERIAEALVCAERLARDEPLLEHAQRRLMKLHYRRGDRAAAMACYERLCAALRDELDDTPSRETVALVRLIEASGPLPLATAPRSPTLRRPPRTIGRERERQRLDAALASGRIAFVLGEPGIGKSRLLEDRIGDGWVATSARPGDAHVPWVLLGRLVRALVARSGTLKAGPLPDWALSELARLAPELGAAAPGRMRPARLLQALDSLLRLARPAGVAVDDLQFADEASLGLLPALAALDTGLPWVVAVRAHEQPPAVTTWLAAVDAGAIERIALGPLDAAQVGELLDSLGLPGLQAAAWAPRLHKHSGGNPLFVLETLRAWLDHAVGTPLAAPGSPPPAPDSLRHLIDGRLARLSPLALKLARVAAVAEADFQVDLAAAALSIHPLDLLDAWHELEAAQVFRDGGFAHDLIAELTRDTVPGALRRWLHARIAAWLQESDSATAAATARHWRAAGEPGRAALAFARAAERARQAGHLTEEARWLQAAIDAHRQAGQPAHGFDAMTRLAIAAREALAPEEALRVSQALVDAAQDAAQRAIAQLQLGACQLNAARFDLASAAFDAAIGAAGEAGPADTSAADTAQHARYLQALAVAQLQGLPEAVRRIEPLIRWAEAHDDASLKHSFLADLAILYDQADQRRRARPFFERALAYFDRSHERANAAPTRMMFARSLALLGDLAQSRSLLEQAVRDRTELSEGEGGQGIEVLNLGRVYVELGCYAQALALLEPLHARLSAPGSAIVRAAVALVLARAHVHLGQAARAMGYFKDVPADAPFHQRALLLWTRALLKGDQPAARAALLDEALAEFADTDLPFMRLPILFDRLGWAPDADAARRLRDGVAECGERELPAPQMLARLRLVQVLVASGDARTAVVVARDLLDDLPRCHPVGLYLPELYAVCRGAALAAADHPLAQRCHDAALRWIAGVANTQVPAAFRPGFAEHNPVNRLLLTAARGSA